MKKKLISFLVLFSMLSSLSFVTSFALDSDNFQNDAQEQIDKTLTEVFEYLNDQSFSLLQLEDKTYTIPVNNEIVTVHVRNEQLQPVSRGSFSDTYTIKPNTSYVFTATINNIFLGSGSVVLKVGYDVGEQYGDDPSYEGMYIVKATTADISATPPTTYSLGTSGTTIDHIYDKTSYAAVAGYVNFTNPILKDIKFTINLSLQSMKYNVLMVTYVYEP